MTVIMIDYLLTINDNVSTLNDCNQYWLSFSHKWQCFFFKWLVSWLTMFQP